MKNQQFTTIVDVVENAIGSRLTSGFLNRRRGLSSKDRQNIALNFANYETADSMFFMPKKSLTEVVPYVHPNWYVSNVLAGRGFEVPLDVNAQSTTIKLLLLYYHRLALPDGFGYLCDIYRFGSCVDKETDRKFDAYLRFFVELRPLIQDGTVFFMPEHPTYFKARDAVAKLKVPDWYDSAFTDDKYRRLHRRMIEESFWIGKEFGVDLFLPTPAASNFLEDYMRRTSKLLSGTSMREALYGSLLLQCKMPRLPKLKIVDITELRRSNYGFACWRSRLRSILASFYEDYASGVFDEKEFQRFANEELAEGKQLVENEIKKSHYLSLLTSGVKSVGIGTATALLTTSDASLPGIVAPIATGSTTFLVDYFLSKIDKGKKQRDALRAHYAVFGTETTAQ